MSIAIPESPLDLAIRTAPDIKAVLINRLSDKQAHFELTVEILDGSKMVIQLLVEIADDIYLTVREKTPSLLPSSCPQRHINSDGSFCLGWLDVQNMKILDQESCAQWWNLVYGYLIRQRRAETTRRWSGDEWAHGHYAAASQCLAEEAAKNLGSDFIIDLKSGKFRVEKVGQRKRPSSLLRVFRDNIHIFSVWEDLRMLTNSKVPCLCKPVDRRRQKKIRSCGNHRQALIDFGIYLNKKEIEETKFLKAYAEARPCCGTLDECPIRDMQQQSHSTGI